MGKSKKPITILLLTLCVFVLAGWGKKSVELLHGEKPLIDLSAAIKESSIGKEGNTQTVEGDGAESDGDIIGSQTVSISVDNPTGTQEEKKVPYEITIRDTMVKYENNEYGEDDMEDLSKKIISDCSNGAGSISLIDHYAEAHVYQKVLAILKQLHEKIGLEYYEYQID